MGHYIKNWSIRTKIMSLAILLEAFVIAGAGFGWISLNRIGIELTSIAHIDIPLTKNIANITEKQLERALHFERAVRYGESIPNDPSALTKMNKSISMFHQFDTTINSTLTQSITLITKALAQKHSTKDSEILNAIKTDFIELQHGIALFEKRSSSAFTMLKKGNTSEADSTLDSLIAEEDKLIELLSGLLVTVETFTQNAGNRALEHEQSAIKILSVLIVVSFILGMAISFWLANQIVTPLRNAINTASGDLRAEIKIETTDETGQLLKAINGMRLKLLAMLNNISSTTEQLSAAAEELAVISAQTCDNVEEQKLETEQVATAMNEMTTTVQGVAENITDTSLSANEADRETKKGHEIVSKTVEEIESLSHQINTATEVVAQLDKDSENINTVLAVIQSIAEQTNLLALNAAIEAARAGEQGRGFAVVADEVRTLAGRTQKSTEEIKQMIERLQTGSRKSVQAMNASRDQSMSAVIQANCAGDSLRNIAESVSKINLMSSQIATASEQQSSVAEEINRNIVRISTMAESATLGISQISEASTDLARMASELRNTVDQFKT